MRGAILQAIENGAFDNGIFLAERLHEVEQNESSLFLVAKCYHLKGHSRCAFEMLKGCKSSENRYLLALCCVSLQMFKEAESALVQGPDWLEHVPNGAFGLQLLGSVYKSLAQTDRAKQCFRAALALNPLMWSAVEALCSLGVDEDPMDGVSSVHPSTESTSSFPHSSPIAPKFVSPAPFSTPNPGTGSNTRLNFDTPQGGVTSDSAFVSPAMDFRGSGVSWVDTLRPLARARWLSSRFMSHEAVAVLKAVVGPQRQSAWACCELGKAYAEMGDYANAEKMFSEAQRIAPWRLEGMEVYSTVLWHLKRATKLSHLAQWLVQMDKTNSPQTWCAVGNCFSLLKEHDSALKFFQRAIQIQPDFSYAHTLSGHEYVANDDLDQALASFRNALQHDSRHYNAWYGMGMLFYRTQRLQLADYHFVQALRINPRSSALHTYRAMVMSKLGEHAEALHHLDVALECNPKNVLAKSQKAHVLILLGQVDEALHMVEEMLYSAPREAFLHFLKGTACAKKGDKETALIHYTMAMDLDARNQSLIKSRIERIYSNPLLEGGLNQADASATGGPAEDEFDVLG